MPQVINTNLASLNAQRMLNSSQASLNNALQRLSSGLRVNSAKDDAAGLAIADRMNSQVRGMNVAIRNANDALSMSQVAEGALSNVGDSLQRMRELAVQAKNATNSGSDRNSLQQEFAELQKEIGRVLSGTQFNQKSILGASAGAFNFQVGANTTVNDVITVTTSTMSTASGIASATATTLSIGSAAGSTGASTAINAIDAALNKVNSTRAIFGAVQNRFDAVIKQLQVNVENQSASRSRIMDADFASETANLTRAQILQQSGVAMLAQANSTPQNVLSLLRG